MIIYYSRYMNGRQLLQDVKARHYLNTHRELALNGHLTGGSRPTTRFSSHHLKETLRILRRSLEAQVARKSLDAQVVLDVAVL